MAGPTPGNLARSSELSEDFSADARLRTNGCGWMPAACVSPRWVANSDERGSAPHVSINQRQTCSETSINAVKMQFDEPSCCRTTYGSHGLCVGKRIVCRDKRHTGGQLVQVWQSVRADSFVCLQRCFCQVQRIYLLRTFQVHKTETDTEIQRDRETERDRARLGDRNTPILYGAEVPCVRTPPNRAAMRIQRQRQISAALGGQTFCRYALPRPSDAQSQTCLLQNIND